MLYIIEPKDQNSSISYAHYQLIVTGHSLGAGTATVLSLLYRNRLITL